MAQGAEVINMSFGGYARSQIEEDALAVAFGQAVLVAAAGNDGKVNLPCPWPRYVPGGLQLGAGGDGLNAGGRPGGLLELRLYAARHARI